MGLIYVSSDSSTLINALKANIKSGKEASEQLKSGSQKIISAVDGKTLSGAAYTAGKGLFSDLIIPTISKVSASVDELETELTKYISADQQVSGEGTLDQEKIERKIEQKKAMKSAVEVSLAAVKAASRSNPLTKIVDATLHVQSSLTNMSNSYEDDIRELEKKLEKLHQFSSTTSALFSNGLSNLKLAMQSVTILNNTIVYPDGTYQLPAGIALSWFDQLKAQDGTNVHNEDKQPDVGNREYKLIDLGYGKLWMWVEKGKNYATSEDIDVTLAYNEWVSRMIDKYGTSFLLGEHQEDFFETFLRQNATLVKELSTGIDSVTGKPLTTQDRLLKMTTLANSMLTAGVAVKGVVDVGKTTTVKKASVPDVAEETVTYRRVQGGQGDKSSQDRIVVDGDGNIFINKKDRDLNISIDNGEHAKYYVENKRPGADIVEIEVPKWFDDFVKENTVPQAGYKNNPASQGGTAPKVTDPTTPGVSIEFPEPWPAWIEENAVSIKIIKGGK